MSLQAQQIVVDAIDKTVKKRLLDDITCTIPSGSITLLLGATGSGKSTLLDVFMGLLQPTSGSVAAGGVPLWRGDGKLRRDWLYRIGAVFQSPQEQLFATTVKAEFDYSLKPYRLQPQEVTHRMNHALHNVQLSAEFLNESPLLLSGGQKRRVAIATTLCTASEWLFLDEPSAGLDGDATAALLDYLNTFQDSAKGGIVIATHDVDLFLPIAQHVILLKDGCLVAECSTSTLVKHPHYFHNAGLELPKQLEIRVELAKIGIAIPDNCWSTMDMATAIVAAVHNDELSQGQDIAATDTIDTISRIALLPRLNFVSPASTSHSRPTKNFSFRAKWIALTFLSIGCFLQHTWLGVALGAIIATLSVVLLRVPLVRLKFLLRALIVVSLMTVFFAGITVHLKPLDGQGMILLSGFFRSFGFSIPSAAVTLLQMCRIITGTITGFALTATCTALELQRGIEQGLEGLRRIHLPVNAFALATTLVFRFGPLLTHALQRFSRIVRVRGKINLKAHSIPIRTLPTLTIPLLLSAFGLAEDMSLAMEARAYPLHGRRTAVDTAKLTNQDLLLIALASTAFVFLLFL